MLHAADHGQSSEEVPGFRMTVPADLPRTIPHVALAAAQKFGAQEGIVDDVVRLTFADVKDRMLAAAAAFVAAGLKKGDTVALWAPNSAAWIVAALAIQSAGGTMVPLNTRYKGGEAQFILNKSRARFLVTVSDFLGMSYPKMLEGLDLPHLERMLVLDRTDGDQTSWTAFLAGADDASRKTVDERLAAMTGDEVSDIMFTSGTTGSPKGVMTTHWQNVRVYYAWGESVGLRFADRYLMFYPYFHCSGYKSGWLACFIKGATTLPEAVLDVPRLMKRAAAEKVTVLPGPPTLFQTLLSAPPSERGEKLSLRLAVTGAASVPPAMIRRMIDELGIQRVMVGYGLTETCGTVTMTLENDPPELVAQSCGVAIPGTEIRCVDENNKPVPIGQAGEIMARGYNNMLGYFEDPKATAETIEPDGWLHTGDIGVIDERGYLRITDRKKDMFIVGGFNCYPAEIEQIMLSNPSYAQVGVIGVADERLGEVGKAFVVPKPGVTLTEKEVIAWCREAMANFKVPRYVQIMDALPLTPSGKVQRFKLKELDQAKA